MPGLLLGLAGDSGMSRLVAILQIGNYGNSKITTFELVGGVCGGEAEDIIIEKQNG